MTARTRPLGLLAASAILAAGAVGVADAKKRSEGTITRGTSNQLKFALKFNRTVDGFELSMGSGRRITSFSAQHYGCRENPLVNGRVVCRMDRRVRAGTAIRGLIKTTPSPKRGMGGRLYGRNGSKRFGPFVLKGP